MKSFIISILLLIFSHSYATHIVGGEILYKYLGTSNSNVNYNIKVYLYIDCLNGNQAAIDLDAQSYIVAFKYDKAFRSYSMANYYYLEKVRTGPERVVDFNYKCIKSKPNACVDKYTFSIDISLPINKDGYVVAYERCCRNNAISNIYNPASTGATYWTKIPGAKEYPVNSSPVFKSRPPNFLCLNSPFQFDHSATDADGDSLAYELFTPYHGDGGGPPVSGGAPSVTNPNDYRPINWNTSLYNVNNQIDGSPTLTINRKTGKIYLLPIRNGLFVIGIKVLEFRKGVLIGETKRDYQFNVSNCVFDVLSSFSVPYYNCTGTTVNFQNRSIGANEFRWDFGVEDDVFDTAIINNPSFTYKEPGNYTVRLIAKIAICADTSEFEINVKKNFVTKLPNDTFVCDTFTMNISADVSNKTYLWSTGETSRTIKVNKPGKYSIAVSDAPCIARDTMEFLKDLDKIDIRSDSVICKDSFVQFIFTPKKGYTKYLWSDGTDKSWILIPKLDKYWVQVQNKYGCTSSDTVDFVLYPPPNIRLHDTLFCRNTTVFLDGVNYNFKTVNETNYIWNNGMRTPNITVGLPGLYTVKVRNKYCTIYDSAQLDYIVTGLDLGADTFYCGPVHRLLLPQQNYSQYFWHDSSVNSTYLATTPGKKKVTIKTVEGCIESDSVQLIQYPVVNIGLGKDTSICLSAKLWLEAVPGMVSYQWNTGEESQSILIKDGGTYIVKVIDQNACLAFDTINIIENESVLPAELYMPNAFTPNNDGLNDVFPNNKYKDPGTYYLLRIYDRWGETIFESDRPSIQWDGTYNGKLAKEDVYTFYVKYTGCDENAHWVRGTLTLMR